MSQTQTDQSNQEVPPEFEALVSEMVDSIINKGITVGDLHGFTEQEYEAVYSLGYNQYKQGKFAEATRYFQFLTFYNHYEPRYSKALGASLQMQERYTDAINAYTMAIIMDAMDPEPMLRMAECLIALGNVDDAQETLDCVTKVCDETGKHNTIKARAEALIAILAENTDKDSGSAAKEDTGE